jgi:hypothetical protein
MREIKRRPIRDWHEDDQGEKSTSAQTETKVGGMTLVGDWSAVNNFMADYQQYLKILGQKHGVEIRQ